MALAATAGDAGLDASESLSESTCGTKPRSTHSQGDPVGRGEHSHTCGMVGVLSAGKGGGQAVEGLRAGRGRRSGMGWRAEGWREGRGTASHSLRPFTVEYMAHPSSPSAYLRAAAMQRAVLLRVASRPLHVASRPLRTSHVVAWSMGPRHMLRAGADAGGVSHAPVQMWAR